jgi:hypothetical protein
MGSGEACVKPRGIRRSCLQKNKEHHQDTKAPRKAKTNAFSVLLGITFGDTRDNKKLGVLVSWW